MPFLFSCLPENPVGNIESAQYSEFTTDSLCSKEIERAKKDIKNKGLVFCMPFGFGSSPLRQEKEIEQLCKKHNMTFEYEVFSDVIFPGQTQGCYGDYMDKIIAEKYGTNFKKTLLMQADSMMLAHNDTIEYYLCDERPQLPGKHASETVLSVSLNDTIKAQLAPDKDGHLPFVDIGFYIDKNGIPSGYFLRYFSGSRSAENQKYKKQLFYAGVEELSKYKYWETGRVKGQNVNTKNNVRIHFY